MERGVEIIVQSPQGLAWPAVWACTYIQVYIRGEECIWFRGGFFPDFFFFLVLPASVDLTETPCPTTTLERGLQNGFQNVLVCLGGRVESK